MNFIGPVIAFAAALHLMALLPMPSRMASLLQKLALVLAVFAPPAMLGFYYFFFAGDADFPLFYDLETNFRAALELYDGGGDVYSVPGAVSFPAPTFWLYWLATGFGAFGAAGVFITFSLMAALCWIAAFFLLRDDLRHMLAQFSTPMQAQQFLFILLAIPGTQSVGQGQTATMVLLGVVITWLALNNPRRMAHLLGGMALGAAATIKPQVALAGIGLLTVAVIDADERPRAGGTLLGAVLGGLAVMALAVILPEGVTFDHIREFFREVLPSLAPPTEEFKVHGSLAFLASVLMTRAGVAEGPADALSTAITLVIVAAFIWKTVRWRADGMPLREVFAMWLAVAVFAPELTWNFYVAWTLPTFALLASDALRRENPRGRLALILVTLLLVNIQVADTPIAVIGLTLLMALVWTYRPSPAQQRTP